MTSLNVKIYRPIHPLLKRFIKYYWIINQDSPVSIHHKILPVKNIDFVLNFSSPIRYDSQYASKEIPNLYFSGIRKKHYTHIQSGIINTTGISFFPEGPYPFLKIPLTEFADSIIALDSVLQGPGSDLVNRGIAEQPVAGQISMIEDALLHSISTEHIPSKKTTGIINEFYNNIGTVNISQFCKKTGINQRTLERIFIRYIGITPKNFQKLNRFQKVLSQILQNKYTDYTSLAYENGYYDQAHFIHDFNSFTGSSPSCFVKDKKSMKQILKNE